MGNQNERNGIDSKVAPTTATLLKQEKAETTQYSLKVSGADIKELKSKNGWALLKGFAKHHQCQIYVQHYIGNVAHEIRFGGSKEACFKGKESIEKFLTYYSNSS